MSERWSDADFDRFAFGTKLAGRTLDACKEVLVDGVAGVDAASKYKLFPGQVSRAVGVLRSKREEMVESAQALQDETALLKFTAMQVAKKMEGPSLRISEPEPGKSYEGAIIVSTHGFAVQKIGRSAVVHDLGKLDGLPSSNVAVSITYPLNGEKAKVADLANARPKELAR